LPIFASTYSRNQSVTSMFLALITSFMSLSPFLECAREFSHRYIVVLLQQGRLSSTNRTEMEFIL
jgi:hypothetical protein